MGQHNSQFWVRISYGTIKYVVDSNQDNTEIPADPQEDQVPQTSIKVVAARSKVKAKPQQREFVGTGTILVNTIHPEPEIHEHIYMTKGYGTMCTIPNTFSTTLSAM